LTDARLWSPDDPYLYDVYTILSVDGKVVDVVKHHRLPQGGMKGGVGTGGVYINDQVRLSQGLCPALHR
jgi:beta-galactosidase